MNDQNTVGSDGPTIPADPTVPTTPTVPKKGKTSVSSLNLSRRRKSKNLSQGNYSSRNSKSNPFEIKHNLNIIEDIKIEQLSREKFTYSLISTIGWWPDEIYTFMQILKTAYADFIGSYISDAHMFDDPLRKSIYFMTQKKYAMIPEIAAFVKSGNFQIPDEYLNHIIKDDPNNMETQMIHLSFVEALEKLLLMGQISEGDITLKKESEDLLRIFVAIYRLIKSCHLINDTLIVMLKAITKFVRLDINLIDLLETNLDQLEHKIFSHFKNIHDKKLFNNACIYRDILLFGLSQCTLFEFVMNYAHRSDKIVLDKLSPLNNHPIFTVESMYRIQYAYKYYLALLLDEKLKNEKATTSRSKPIRPTYFVTAPIEEKEKRRFSIFDHGNRSMSEHVINNRSRKYSIDISSLEPLNEQSYEVLSPRNVQSSFVDNSKLKIKNRNGRSQTVIEYVDADEPDDD